MLQIEAWIRGSGSPVSSLLKTIGHLGVVIGQCPRFSPIGTPLRTGLGLIKKSRLEEKQKK